MGVPPQGTAQQDYRDHMVYDSIAAGVAGPGLLPGNNPSMDFMENLLGQRTGVGITTPWSTPIRTGIRRAVYTDTGAAGTVYAAGPPATATDAGKAWVASQWVGRTCFAINAAGGITKFRIASNTPTVLSAAAGVGWSNGTPTNGNLYWIAPDDSPSTSLAFSPQRFMSDNWWGSLRQAPGNPGAE